MSAQKPTQSSNPRSSNTRSSNTRSNSYAQEYKGKTGISRIIKAVGYSIDGFVAAYKNEPAFRQVLLINVVLLGLLIPCPFTMTVKMILVFASVFSLVVELFNTGIEAAIDHTSTERHPLAKIAKDVGSAAQFLALGLLLVLWAMAVVTVS